jgi:regulator of cell morphogenesis and NO signaling
MNHIDLSTTLNEFLLASPEQARVIGPLGPDSRRDGSRSLADICQTHGLEPQTFARMLAAFARARSQPPPVCLELMTLKDLCDHLEQSPRVTLQDELARLDQLTRVATEQYGAEHPQLLRTRKTFVAFRERFTAHLHEEAENLFPLIRRLTTGKKEARSALKSRLARMEHEHNQADEALAELHALAGEESLRPPVPAAVRMVSDAIVRLEQAIHEQIYKENQVLFPRALAIGGSA